MHHQRALRWMVSVVFDDSNLFFIFTNFTSRSDVGKLSRLAPTLKKLAPTIGRLEFKTDEQMRASNRPSRAWYKTKAWQTLRWNVLVRDLFTCRMCGAVKLSNELCADHIIPHRDSKFLFWDINNLQTLCIDPCHNKIKQKQEQNTPVGVWN